MAEGWIPADESRTVAANVPNVSADLLIRTNAGLLFGNRTNEPAQGYWFPPGGHVGKGETREEAAYRVAREECGLDVELVESPGAFETFESPGAFEHIYETTDVPDVGGKHYLANGYVADTVVQADGFGYLVGVDVEQLADGSRARC
jgi:colanic acid biosynthesis protein WcaH